MVREYANRKEQFFLDKAESVQNSLAVIDSGWKALVENISLDVRYIQGKDFGQKTPDAMQRRDLERLPRFMQDPLSYDVVERRSDTSAVYHCARNGYTYFVNSFTDFDAEEGTVHTDVGRFEF